MVTIAAMNDQPTIVVEDTGIGIPKDDMDRIFERFYRVDKSHSNQKEGSGLGLSIAAGLTRRMGGTVSADLEENIFSVRVLFPIQTGALL